MPAKIPKPTSPNNALPVKEVFTEEKSSKLMMNLGANPADLEKNKTQKADSQSENRSDDVQKYLKDYLLAVKETGCSSATIRNYKSDINQFLDFLGSSDLNDLRNKPKLLAFARYQREKGLKENSIKRKLVSITQFKIWLKQEGMLASEIPLSTFEQSDTTENDENDQLERKIIGQGSEKKTKEIPKLEIPLQEISQKKKKPRSRLLILLNLLALFLFLGGLAYFAYQQFGQAIISMAYPSTPTAPNHILSYQGRLTDTAQTPISVPTNMTYALYDADTAGNLLWSSNTCSIDPDQDGIFNANLGAGNGTGADNDNCGGTIAESVFTENTNVWLEVAIGAETLAPRQPIRTVPYALNAGTLQGLPPAEIATNSTILMMNSAGEVVLGTDNPVIKAASTSSGMTIEANQITIQTATGSNGDIVLAPDGTGSVDIRGDLSVSGSSTLVGNTYITSPNTLIFGGTTALGEISSPTDSGAYLIGVFDEFNYSSSTNIQGVLNDLDAALGSAGTSVWSDLTAPGANLSLDHGTFTTGFNWDTGTGTDNLFSLTTDASSNGTGSLLNLQTGTSSTISPLRVRAGSTEALFVDNTGKVGVGTNSPSQLLTLNGGQIDVTRASGGQNVLAARINGDGFDRFIIDSWGNLLTSGGIYSNYYNPKDSTQDVAFLLPNSGKNLNFRDSTNTTNLVSITGAGSFGIGDSTPDHTLDVAGNIGLNTSGYINFGDTDGSTGYGLRDNTGTLEYKNSGGTWAAIGSGSGSTAWSDLTDPTANLSIDMGSYTTAFNWTSGGIFAFDGDGNVGIGTASPASKLDVVGTVQMTGLKMTTSPGAGYVLTSDASGNGSWSNISSSANAGPWTLSGSSLYPDSTSYNVGIGTSTPGGKLDISGGILAIDNGDLGTPRGIRFRETTDTTTPSGAAIYQANNNNLYLQAGSANYISLRNYAGTNQFSFNTNSAVLGIGTAGGGLKPSSSDSTTAIQIKDYNDNAFVNFDTTNHRVGIGNTSPTSMLSVGATSQFQVDDNGDIVKLKDLTYSWPSSQATGLLNNDGSGNLTWGTIGTSEITNNSLDFIDFQDTLDLDADLTLNQDLYSWVQNYTGTTGTGFTYNANSLTSGKGMYLLSSSTGLTGNLAEFVLSGDNAANTGNILRLAQTGTLSAAVPLMITNLGTGASFRVNDETGDTDSTPFIIDAAGNVGIGLTNPTSKLQIGGASSTISNDTGDIAIDAASSNISLSGDNLINVNNGLFAGSVGVGTALPIFQTEIYGAGQLTAALTDAGNRTGMLALNGNSTTAGAGGAIVFGNSSSHTANSVGFAAIKGLLTDSTANTMGALAFSTRAATSDTALTERMRITPAGWLGIGTSNPSEMLGVNGSIVAEKYYDLTNKNYYLDPAAVGTSLKIAGNAEIEGNIGIGTAATGYKLSIGGATSVISNLSGDITIDPASGNLSLSGNNLTNVADGYFANGYFSNSVGIGTTSPVQKLHVEGQGFFADVGTSWDPGDGGGAGTRIGYDSSLDIGYIVANNTGVTTKNLALQPSGGNVGIGTTNPSTYLHVVGTTDVSQTTHGLAVFGAIDTANIAIDQNEIMARNNGVVSPIYINNEGGDVFMGGSTGNVGIGLTSPQASLHISKNGINNIIIRSQASNADANTTLEALGIYNMSFGVYSTSLYTYYTDSTNVARYIATTGTAIDLAEWYKIGSASLDSSGNSKLKKGQLLCIDNSATEKVVACSAENNQLIGIVSTQSYQTMGMNNLDDDHHDATEVALAGRVPLITIIKETDKQIKAGDHLTSSSLTGVASKATKAGNVVAKALDKTNWSAQSCPAVSSLDAINWPSDDGTNQQKPCFTLPDGSIVGKIMAFVNISWYDPSAYLQLADLNLDANGDVVIDGNTRETYAIATPTGLADRISVFADLFTARLQAGFIKTKELIADTFTSTNATITNLIAHNLETDTITSSDGQIDIVSNASVSGNLAVSADLNVNGDLNVDRNIMVNGDSEFTNLEVTGETKLALLNAEDITVSGDFTANQVQINDLEANSARINAIEAQLANIENATVSGTLYAENIEANSISANVISGLKERLSEQIAETLTQPTLLASLFAQQTAQTDEYLSQLSQEINSETDLASSSASLAELDANSEDSILIADNAFINQYFEVNGNAYISNSLKLGQSLMVGSDTVYSTNYISYQPTDIEDFTFYIQPAGTGRLSLMAGLMELDHQGFVNINGDLKVAGTLEIEDDLKVKGTLLTNLITANNPGEDIQVQLSNAQEGSDSATISKSDFEFIDENQTPVATVSANGDLSLAGSLRINNPATASESSALTNNSSSAGQAVLEAGSKEITIMSDKVEENSMIYVTPLNSTDNQVLYVKNKVTDSSFTPENEAQFTVAIDYVLSHNVVFNWWIVQLN